MVPKTLTNFSWFDNDGEEIILAVTAKTTMTFTLEEFSELHQIIVDTRESLLKLPEVSIGSYEKNGEKFEELIYIPDPEDYN